jgi:hypothetical protein
MRPPVAKQHRRHPEVLAVLHGEHLRMTAAVADGKNAALMRINPTQLWIT